MKRRTVLGLGAAGLIVGSSTVLTRLSPATSDWEANLISDMLSQARQAAGLPALTPHGNLGEMGLLLVHHMAAVDRATHHDGAGHNPEKRGLLAGYDGRILGEALAATYDGPVETMDAWLAQGVTRDVLMDLEAQDLGVAVAVGPSGRRWWSVVLGGARLA